MRVILMTSLLLGSSSAAHACVVGDLLAPPAISIASTPGNCCHGEWAGTIAGTVTNVETDSVMVVLYAQTDQYYIQPGAGEMGKTPVNCPGGDFANSTRGGNRYCAILAKRSWDAPATMTALPPPGGGVLAIACEGNTPEGVRTLNFSGLPWLVRSSHGSAQGPGPNVFSDSTANVWLDAEERLHLRITHRDGGWQCAEIYSDAYLGYGAYGFQIETPPDSLDPRVVLGCFSYSDQYNLDGDEIDIEFSRWDVPADLNSQFVVQPYNLAGHLYRFDTVPAGSVHEFVWEPDRVGFSSREGTLQAPGAGIASWIYTGRIPTPDFERMRFNLWLFRGTAPSDSSETEVVVSAFRFQNPVSEVGPSRQSQDLLRIGTPFPQPARDRLRFTLTLARPAPVRVRLFDLSGRARRTLLDGRLAEGTHDLGAAMVDASGHRFAAGVYFVRAEAGREVRVARVVLLP